MNYEKLNAENLRLRERNRELKREIRKLVADKHPDIDTIIGAMLEEYRDRCEAEFEHFRERCGMLIESVEIVMPRCDFEESKKNIAEVAA